MKKKGISTDWGGARKGAGRKKLDLSEKELNILVKEFKKLAKETGKHIAQVLAEIAYGKEKVPVVVRRYSTKKKKFEDKVEWVDPPLRLRLKAIEMYYAQAMVKQVHKTAEDIRTPTIYLPQYQEDDETVEVH